jgi:uncharacterized protein YkwD
MNPKSTHLAFGPVVGAVLVALALLTGCGSIKQTQELEDRPVFTVAPVDRNGMLAMLNNYRETHGLPALAPDEQLDSVSTSMARHIAERDSMDTWAHSAFGLSQRLEKAGYGNYAGAENLGAGYASLDAAFTGWQNSKDHNKNLLNPYVTRVGIARVNRSNGKWRNFWVMTLSRPIADGRPDPQ